MKLPVMTTRRWMVVVAGAAMLLWSWLAWVHWNRCMKHARTHAAEARYEESYAENLPPIAVCGMSLASMIAPAKRHHFASLRSDAERRKEALRNAAYHSQIKRKLEQAAWRPWEPFPVHLCDPLEL